MDLDTRFRDALADIEQHLLATYRKADGGYPDFRDAVSAAYKAGVLADRDVKDLDDLRPLRNLLAHSRWDGRPPVSASLSGVVRAGQLNEQLTGSICSPTARAASRPCRRPTRSSRRSS